MGVYEYNAIGGRNFAAASLRHRERESAVGASALLPTRRAELRYSSITTIRRPPMRAKRYA